MLKEFLLAKLGPENKDQLVIRDITNDDIRNRLVNGLGSRYTPTTAIHHDGDDFDTALPIETIVGPKFDAFNKYLPKPKTD